MIIQAAAAFLGTVAFAVLFGVPRQYYGLCGITGCLGWITYLVLGNLGCGIVPAALFATILVNLLSRSFAVRARCPVTVFLICGIFPLVPGSGIYWTVYYVVMEQYSEALASGTAALKAAIAIVLGIVLVSEMPKSIKR
ncbi:MAG: threonine/serine exporter family protein [Lachnospiraceae bacterium]|nr:threonine/serine exporter family protein [Lachnospiraceae bacterium]